jgi:protein TonB
MYASPKRSTLISGLVHAVAIALIVLTGGVVTTPPSPVEHATLVIPRDLTKYEITRTERADAGGGGGKHDPLPATKGELPKLSRKPWMPPTVKKENLHPILTFEEAIAGNPSMILTNIPLIGDLKGLRGVLSDGPGDGGGIGPGKGPGVGPGNGPGAGPGDRGGISGIQGFRGKLTQPVATFKPEPDYSEEARKAKHQGSVMIEIVVDERGLPRNIVVTKGLGLGLDERAVEAVKKWRFRPGTHDGKPVPMAAIVEVTFRLL